MPNARQLLEQADALMRRNRKRGKGKGNGPPTLTDALTSERTGTLAPTIILPEALPAADPIALDALPTPDPIALDTLSDLPVLTDVVDSWSPQAEAWPPVVPDADASALAEALDDALANAPESSADAESGLTADVAPAEVPPTEQAAVIIAAPVEEVSVASVDEAAVSVGPLEDAAISLAPVADDAAAESGAPPLPIQDEEFILDIPPMSETPLTTPAGVAAPAAPVVAAIPEFVPGSPAWEAMAEEIRMQVLQRLDLFTETGMRDQLGARLQPIVARASGELIETINLALGELVRGYVAEAIEREIESWRKRDG